MNNHICKLDSSQLRRAFGTFITGVTVVTASSNDNVPVGFTANSFVSVSINPPLLLVCPAKTLSSFGIFNTCQHFTVNILAEHQREIANIFATSRPKRFSRVNWSPDNHGSPLIDDAAAFFSCQTHQRIDAGDHVILLGKIIDFAVADTTTALGYINGGYFGMNLERQAGELAYSGREVTVGVIIDYNGRILLKQTDKGLALPQIQSQRHAVSLTVLREFLAAAGLQINIGAVYSIFEGPTVQTHSIYYRGTATTDNTGGLGEYYPIDDLLSLPFTTEPLRVMLRRYYWERQNGAFGLYVGSEHTGDIHHLPVEATTT